VFVLAYEDVSVSLTALGDRAAAFLALRMPPGAQVTRIPSVATGELLSVAEVAGAGRVENAYVGISGPLRYLVVRRYDDDSTALARLQADSVVAGLKLKTP
jgi:hypothetical protein